VSHVTHMNESCHTRAWAMSHIPTNYFTRVWYEWVMSHASRMHYVCCGRYVCVSEIVCVCVCVGVCVCVSRIPCLHALCIVFMCVTWPMNAYDMIDLLCGMTHTYVYSHVCDMAHEYVRHDWSIAWHDSCICVLSCVWHDPWICATWFIYLVARLIHMCTLMGVTWPMNVCDMIYLLCGTTHTYVYPQMCDMTHLHVCDMTHPLVCDMTHPHLTDK